MLITCTPAAAERMHVKETLAITSTVAAGAVQKHRT
jgi:hypothetical protein